MNTQTTRIAYVDFLTAQQNYEGFCTTCQRFTNTETEPDAVQYECVECGNMTVYGTDEAVLMGLIASGGAEE